MKTIDHKMRALTAMLLLGLVQTGCGDGANRAATDSQKGGVAAEERSSAPSLPSLGELAITGNDCPITTAQAKALLNQPVSQTQDDSFACVFATPGGIGADYSLSIQWDGDAANLGQQTGGDELNAAPAPELGAKAERYSYESGATVAAGSAFAVGDRLVNVMINVLPEQSDRGRAAADAVAVALARP